MGIFVVSRVGPLIIVLPLSLFYVMLSLSLAHIVVSLKVSLNLGQGLIQSRQLGKSLKSTIHVFTSKRIDI